MSESGEGKYPSGKWNEGHYEHKKVKQNTDIGEKEKRKSVDVVFPLSSFWSQESISSASQCNSWLGSQRVILWEVFHLSAELGTKLEREWCHLYWEYYWGQGIAGFTASLNCAPGTDVAFASHPFSCPLFCYMRYASNRREVTSCKYAFPPSKSYCGRLERLQLLGLSKIR